MYFKNLSNYKEKQLSLEENQLSLEENLLFLFFYSGLQLLTRVEKYNWKNCLKSSLAIAAALDFGVQGVILHLIKEFTSCNPILRLFNRLAFDFVVTLYITSKTCAFNALTSIVNFPSQCINAPKKLCKSIFIIQYIVGMTQATWYLRRSQHQPAAVCTQWRRPRPARVLTTIWTRISSLASISSPRWK